MKRNVDGKRKVSIYYATGVSTKEEIKNLFLTKFQNGLNIKQRGSTDIFYVLDKSWQSIDWGDFFQKITDEAPDASPVDRPWGILFFITKNKNCLSIPFGAGGGKLDKSKFVYNFGLKTTLNMIDENSIMHQTSKAFSQNKLRKDVASANRRRLGDLGFDELTDILSNVDGEPKAEYKDSFTSKISGSQSLNITLSPTTVVAQLGALEKAYAGKAYETSFGFIDNLSPLSKGETTLKTELNLKIYEALKNGDYAVFAPLPSDSYYSIRSCEFRGKTVLFTNQSFFEAINLASKTPDELVRFLKINKATVNLEFKDSESSEEVALYKFLSLDVKHEDQHFLLENGMWFRVNPKLVNVVDQYFSERVVATPKAFAEVALENKNKEGREWRALQDEGKYLGEICKRNPEYVLGDKQLVEETEVFDLFHENVLFHVKKGTSGSAPLSHLFKQGLVSIRRLTSEQAFLGKAKKKIGEFDLNSSRAVVAFGIIKNTPKLPIFSKISFRMDSINIEKILKEKVRVFFIKHEVEAG